MDQLSLCGEMSIGARPGDRTMCMGIQTLTGDSMEADILRSFMTVFGQFANRG